MAHCTNSGNQLRNFVKGSNLLNTMPLIGQKKGADESVQSTAISTVLVLKGGIYMQFDDMNIKQETKNFLKKNGFTVPTEVQEKVIPVASHRDVIVQSRTGSGKTLAFLIPVFEKVERGNFVETIILVPTRELAQQVERVSRGLGKEHGVKTLAIYGGASMERQIAGLPSTIVVGTPGRVMDLMRRGYLHLKSLKFFILDEADRIMDMGFLDDILWIMERTNKDKRVLLFSATMPGDIIRLARKYTKNPEKFILSEDEITAKGVVQYRVNVGEINKMAKLSALLDSEPGKYLIFCNTKRKTQEVADKLRRLGYKSYALHGDMRQGMRTRTMDAFKRGDINILISTDVAARGIDVTGITHVVNYDVPMYPKDYVHRIGRTGRMDRRGKAVTFVTHNDETYIRRIEDLIGSRIPEMKLKGVGKIRERIDYREYSDIYGMVRFHFKLRRELSEWEIIKNIEKEGVDDNAIGKIDVAKVQGTIDVHYSSAHRIKKVGIFKNIELVRRRYPEM